MSEHFPSHPSTVAHEAQLQAPEAMGAAISRHQLGFESLKRFMGRRRAMEDTSNMSGVEGPGQQPATPEPQLEEPKREIKRPIISQTYRQFESILGSRRTPTVQSYRSMLGLEEKAQPHYSDLERLESEERQLDSQAAKADEFAAHKAIRTEIDAVRAQKAAYGEDAISAWQQTRTKKEELEERHRLLLAPSDPLAGMLMSMIKTAAKEQEGPLQPEAPFKNHAQNTEQAWQHVPDQQIRDFLTAKEFRVTDGAVNLKKGYDALIKAGPGESIEIPGNLFIYAEGFDSWLGRGHRGGNSKDVISPHGKYKDKSLNVIKHYASLPTELPAVMEARVFVQPDGKVFCDNASGDSHRIAAALLRGQETIKADKVDVIVLEENYL